MDEMLMITPYNWLHYHSIFAVGTQVFRELAQSWFNVYEQADAKSGIWNDFFLASIGNMTTEFWCLLVVRHCHALSGVEARCLGQQWKCCTFMNVGIRTGTAAVMILRQYSV
jgi:hypothetical protein